MRDMDTSAPALLIIAIIALGIGATGVVALLWLNAAGGL